MSITKTDDNTLNTKDLEKTAETAVNKDLGQTSAGFVQSKLKKNKRN